MTIRSYQYRVEVLVSPSTSGNEIARSASNTLVLGNDAEFEAIVYPAESNLNLVSDAQVGPARRVNQNLLLVQDAVWDLQPANVTPVESELALAQDVHVFGFETVESALALSSVAEGDILDTNVAVSQLGLAQTVDLRRAVQNLSVTNDLALTDSARITFTPNVTTFLNLDSVAFRAFVPSSELNLVQTVSAGKGIDVEQALDLDSTVLLNKVLNQNLTSPNVVVQSVTWFVESPCNRYTYNRFHGTGGVEPATKRLEYANDFYLQSIDDGTTIFLRNPETDDRKRYAFNRVNRNFFDGSPDIYSDDDWAVEQSQIYTVVANKREKLQPLYDFLQDNLGREIIIKDWKGTTWIVIITNPGDLYTEDGEDYWTLNFDVEGEAVDGEWFFNRLELVQTPSRAGSIYNRAAVSDLAASSVVGRNYEFGEVDITQADVVSQEVSYVIE